MADDDYGYTEKPDYHFDEEPKVTPKPFSVLFPELNENQRKQLATLIEGAIGKDTPHGSGQNTAYEAGIDWRNQMRQEIRNNLKEAGILL